MSTSKKKTPVTVVTETVVVPEIKENTYMGRTKKVELADKIVEIEELGGRCSGKRACEILSQATGKEIKVTTLNNLAYSGKIDTVKIASVFLFLIEGPKSVTAYIPTLLSSYDKKVERTETKQKKETAKTAKAILNEYINKAIENGQLPDITALKEKLGI